MNGELELKIQAYLDGELEGRERARVEDWLEHDEEAQAVLAELTMTRDAFAVGELERSLPESGDFYWSKIRREIDRVDRLESDPEPGWVLGLRRLMAPAAGVALLFLMGFVLLRTFSGLGPASESASYLVEVETPSEEVGAYSFRSETDNVFVVWVYDRPPQPAGERDVTEDM